jgi:hypothetical protein
VNGWLRDSTPSCPTFSLPVAKAWAQLEILADCAYTELRENGIFSRGAGDEVIGRRLLEDFRKLRSVQLPFANALGLTPLSRFQIKAGAEQVAFDIAQAASSRIDATLADRAERGTAGESVPPSVNPEGESTSEE